MPETLTSFIAMGGHGAFIWPAWGIAAGVIAAITIASRRRLTALRPNRGKNRHG